MVLLEQTWSLLTRSGLRVHTHHLVPANDGGIALGQAVVAATHYAAGTSAVNEPEPDRPRAVTDS